MPTITERLVSLAREARDHAEEILARAETMQDAEARRMMREIAEGYERLAERIEKAASGG
jgi:DNA-binding ferritin-like protein